MTSSLFSPVWHRVAERRPRLRSSIQISRQVTRGEIWHVLSDPISGQRCRLNPQAWQFVGRLDGARTVEQTWDRLAEVAGEDLPTQDEIVHLLGQLVAQGMVTMDVLPDFASRAWRRGSSSPFPAWSSSGSPRRSPSSCRPPGSSSGSWPSACCSSGAG